MTLDKLDNEELIKVKKLNDPICDLILINGWRRDGIRQAIENYRLGNKFVKYTPKKANKEYKFLLNDKEIKLILKIRKIFLVQGWPSTPKPDDIFPKKSTFNRYINKHFEALSRELDFKIYPHRLRRTFASNLNSLGIDRFTIKSAMNHKNISTTEKYIDTSDEEILNAKNINMNYITLDGLTIQEWKKIHIQDMKIIRRLELSIRNLKELNNAK